MIYEIFRLHDGPGALRGRKEEESGVQWMVKKLHGSWYMLHSNFFISYFFPVFVRAGSGYARRTPVPSRRWTQGRSSEIQSQRVAIWERRRRRKRRRRRRKRCSPTTTWTIPYSETREVLKWISLVFFCWFVGAFNVVMKREEEKKKKNFISGHFEVRGIKRQSHIREWKV